MLALFGLSLALPLLSGALAFDNAAMRSKAVYQVVTDRFALSDGSTNKACNASARQYCGGTWKGLTAKLDYIQGMGFDTVWISPIVQNIGGDTGYGQAYHGYWSLDVTQLNSQFGTADDLKALASALHSKNMYLMVDVVINHVAATSGSSFQTSNVYGPFSQQANFHSFQWITNYENQTQVEQGWLGDNTVALPDINTEQASVVAFWNQWISQIVSNYTVDVIRIDTVKHIRHDFWPAFTAAAGVANVGEVLYFDPDYVGSYQRNATINPFNYAVYYPLVRAFNNSQGSLEAVSQMTRQVAGNSTDTSLYGSFLNNHDNARFESVTSDPALIRNAHVYPFVTDGVPYLYYGSENGFNGQNDPLNREPFWPTGYNTSAPLYSFFKRLNLLRRAAAASGNGAFYTTNMSITVPTQNEMLIVKYPLVSVLSNVGYSSSAHNVSITGAQVGWTANLALVDAIQCGNYTTDGSGNLQAQIVNGLPMVFIEASKAGATCQNYVANPINNGSNPNSGGGSGGSGGKSAATREMGMSAWGLGMGAILAVAGLLVL